jgi:hypothetical protein
MEDEKTSVLIHTAAGMGMGYFSISFTTLQSILIGLLLLILLGRVIEKVVKEKRDFKWWIANGFFIYLSTWLVVWVFFYNMVI